MSELSNTVLIITKDAASRGGVSAYFNLLFRGWCYPSIRVERFAVGSRSADYARRKDRPIAYAFQLACDLVRLSQRLSADRSIKVVQVNPSLVPISLFRDGMMLYVARRAGRKTIAFFRGWKEEVAGTLQNSYLGRRCFLRMYGGVTKYVTLADTFAFELSRIGIDTTRITVSRTMYDGLLVQPRHFRSREVRFLFVSRISEAKGVIDLVRAAALVRARGLDFRVALFGHPADGRILHRLTSEIASFDMGEIITVGGYLNDTEKYAAFACHDVLILASHHEGCPNTVLEALGAGMFVVASRVGAIPEILDQGETGFVVAPRNPAALAHSMSWCVDNADEVRSRSAMISARAKARFESAVIVRQMAGLYEGLLK